MESGHLISVLESILFVSSKPMSAKELAKFLDMETEPVSDALHELVKLRREAGVIVLESNGLYQMATNSANTTVVKNFLNQDLREKLTDATLEVLAIISYRQPISKVEIEAIRGVNSQYSIRHLLMRGMIEKVPNPNDARGFLYQTTTEFLQHMGLASTSDLPSFEELVSQIKLPETPALSSSGTAETPDIAETESEPAEAIALIIEESVDTPEEIPLTEPISETAVEDTESTQPIIAVITENTPGVIEPGETIADAEDEDEYDEDDEEEDDEDETKNA
jgi:segregation and condensation protein B